MYMQMFSLVTKFQYFVAQECYENNIFKYSVNYISAGVIV